MNFEVEQNSQRIATVFDVDSAIVALNSDRLSVKNGFWMRYRRGTKKNVQEVQKLTCA